MGRAEWKAESSHSTSTGISAPSASPHSDSTSSYLPLFNFQRSLSAIINNLVYYQGANNSTVARLNTGCLVVSGFQINNKYLLVQVCPMQYLGNSHVTGYPHFILLNLATLPFTKTKLFILFPFSLMFINPGERREEQIRCVFPQIQICECWGWRRMAGQGGFST